MWGTDIWCDCHGGQLCVCARHSGRGPDVSHSAHTQVTHHTPQCPPIGHLRTCHRPLLLLYRHGTDVNAVLARQSFSYSSILTLYRLNQSCYMHLWIIGPSRPCIQESYIKFLHIVFAIILLHNVSPIYTHPYNVSFSVQHLPGLRHSDRKHTRRRSNSRNRRRTRKNTFVPAFNRVCWKQHVLGDPCGHEPSVCDARARRALLGPETHATPVWKIHRWWAHHLWRRPQGHT